MTPDDEVDIGHAIKEAIRKARGYADFFGWGSNRDFEELGVMTSLAESLEKSGALFFSQIRLRGRGSDPPDLEALDAQGRRVAFEVTELVDGKAIQEYKGGKRYGFSEWTRERFVSELHALLHAKNSRFPKLRDAPYDGGYIVVVFTDEPELAAPVVEGYLNGQRFTGLQHVSRAFLVISYDPRLEMCPYFELTQDA